MQLFCGSFFAFIFLRIFSQVKSQTYANCANVPGVCPTYIVQECNKGCFGNAAYYPVVSLYKCSTGTCCACECRSESVWPGTLYVLTVASSPDNTLIIPKNAGVTENLYPYAVGSNKYTLSFPSYISGVYGFIRIHTKNNEKYFLTFSNNNGLNYLQVTNNLQGKSYSVNSGGDYSGFRVVFSPSRRRRLRSEVNRTESAFEDVDEGRRKLDASNTGCELRGGV